MIPHHCPEANGILAGDLNGNKRPEVVGCTERGSNEARCWCDDQNKPD